MRVVIQRVQSASVSVKNEITGEISKGLCVLFGVGPEDNNKKAEAIIDRLINLRIFEDENGKMNLSLIDIKGELLIVSQFTLYGDCRKGRRPSFTTAAKPELANPIYEHAVKYAREKGIKVGTGVFGAEMLVDIKNDGPVTFILDE